MNPSRVSSLGRMKLPLLLVIAVAAGAGVYRLTRSPAPEGPRAHAPAAASDHHSHEDNAAAHAHGEHAHESGGGVPVAVPRPPAPLNAQALAAVQAFARLRDLPAGDAAIELAHQLEAGITADNMAGYVQTLLTTQNRAVERAAIAALARAADGAVMQELVGAYGTLPPEQRGRILQVLEGAANPAAWQALAGIAASDTSEKRSPVALSALTGVANIGSMEAVQYLLTQLTPGNSDFALVALRRVRSAQGIEMIRAAAQGSKDSSGIEPAFRDALKQVVSERQ